jgi:hypothetical protein
MNFIREIAFGILVSAAFIQTGSAATIHRSFDFEEPLDTVGDHPSGMRIYHGDPRVVASFGDLDGQALLFNPNIHAYEQVEIRLGRRQSSYRIDFDVQTQGLVGSDYMFTMLMDTPTVQNVWLHGQGYIGSHAGGVGTFTDNQRMHFTIDVDFISRSFVIDTGGIAPTFTGVFNPSGSDIQDIRFALSPWKGGAEMDPTVYVGLDNIQISTIPVPGAVWLFGSALAGLGVWRRRTAA